MKKIFILFIIFLAINITSYATDNSKTNKCEKYSNCELGDLVGDDVKRLYYLNYYADYHSDDFLAKQVKFFIKKCLKEGVTTQYQMDCCTSSKMYP